MTDTTTRPEASPASEASGEDKPERSRGSRRSRSGGGPKGWPALLGPLQALEALEATATETALAVLEVVRWLRAEVDEHARSGGQSSPYAAHNLAWVVTTLLELDGGAKLHRDLAIAAHGPLNDAHSSDDQDALVVLALLRIATLRAPHPSAVELLAAAADVLAKPTSGDRLREAHAQLVAHLSTARDKQIREAAERYAESALAELQQYLAHRPFSEPAARSRLDLLSLRVRRTSAKARDAAYRELQTALADYGGRFGRTPAFAVRDLRAIVDRLVGEDSASSSLRKAARKRLLESAPLGGVDSEELLTAARALDRAKVLEGQDYAALAGHFAARLPEADEATAESLRRARRHALESANDRDALFDDSVEALRRDPADRHAAGDIVKTIVDALARSAPTPEIAPEMLRTAAAQLPAGVAARWSSGHALGWLKFVGEQLGADVAAEHAASVLLGVKQLRKHAALTTEIVRLLLEGGRRSEALRAAEDAFTHHGHAAMRLEFARLLLDASERLSEADKALKPLIGSKGELREQAEALRDRLHEHPDFAESRRNDLLDFERKLGVGAGKPLRLKILYTSDTFALAEVADKRAPAAYGQGHLRVMVRPSELPSYLGLADLKKGQTLLGPVKGEDDKRPKKGSLRVYWVADGAVVDPGWPDAEKEKFAAALDERFSIGTGALVPLKVLRIQKRGGALWVRPHAEDRGPAFPHELRVPAGDLPSGVSLDSVKPGSIYAAPVDTEKVDGRGAGERRWRVRGPLVGQEALG